MRVTGYGGTALDTAFFARRSVYQKTAAAPSETRSLVVRPAPPAFAGASWQARPRAAFLAQLIAKTEDMPVSRTRRRADLAEGVRAYRAAADLAGLPKGKSLRVI